MLSCTRFIPGANISQLQIFLGEIETLENYIDGGSMFEDLFKNGAATAGLFPELKRIFEGAFGKLIFGVPKYLDRRDLIGGGEEESKIFEEFLSSEKSFRSE